MVSATMIVSSMIWVKNKSCLRKIDPRRLMVKISSATLRMMPKEYRLEPIFFKSSIQSKAIYSKIFSCMRNVSFVLL